MLPGMILPLGVANMETPSLAFVERRTAGGATNISVASVNFGDPSPTRRIIIGVTYANSDSRQVNSATIGGVAATIHVNASSSTSDVQCSLLSAIVPSGISGTVNITLSGHGFWPQLGIWRGVALPTITDTDEVTGTSGGSAAMSVNVAEQGFVVAIANRRFGTSFSWSGATEDFDNQAGDDDHTASGAHSGPLAAETDRAITATFASGFHAAAVMSLSR